MLYFIFAEAILRKVGIKFKKLLSGRYAVCRKDPIDIECPTVVIFI